jgi:AcrR family transcriptional regulator
MVLQDRASHYQRGVSATYTCLVPRLWNDTIEEHRQAVREATLDAAAALVAERGLAAVTMTQIAERTGIGRATLYKYFPDVESILRAWHERQIAAHFEQLAHVRDRVADPAERLGAVLEAFALIAHQVQGHHDGELAALLHGDVRLAGAQHQLRALVTELVQDAASAGAVRDDISADELAGYCVHALTAARNLGSKAAVKRLVSVTLDALRPVGG